MSKTRHIVTNPYTDHSVTFLQTGAETNGQLLQIEYMVSRPEQPLQVIPLHVHSQVTERFTVVSGKLGVILGNKKVQQIVAPGEVVDVPPGVPHAFWNAGDGELRFLTDIEPGGQLQTYWETAFGLAVDGKVNEQGVPHFWQIAVLFPVMDTYLPQVPMPLQNSVFALLGWVGRLLGYRAEYPQYSA